MRSPQPPIQTRRPLWVIVVPGLGAALAIAILYFFPPDQSWFYPRCLWYAMTGLQCPGCGGLRAVHQLLHGNLMAALALNPLVVVSGYALLFALLWQAWARLSGRPGLVLPSNSAWLWLALVAIVLFGIGRNLLPFFL